MVCISSMKRTMLPSEATTSFSTALSRSSNSPRYFAPGDHRAEVEREEPLPLQPLRHVAVDDAPREPLDDRGLADARVADEHRVVLRAAREDLDDAADLVVPPDHRVELPLPRELGEVLRVLLERAVLALRLGGGDARAAADVLQRLPDPLRRRARRAERLAGAGLLLRRREQEVLGRDVLVLELLRLVLGAIEELREPVREVGLRAGDLRDAAQLVLDARRDERRLRADLVEDRAGDPLLLREEREHEVLDLDRLVVAAARLRLGARQRLLGLHRELFRSHGANVRPEGVLASDGLRLGWRRCGGALHTATPPGSPMSEPTNNTQRSGRRARSRSSRSPPSRCRSSSPRSPGRAPSPSRGTSTSPSTRALEALVVAGGIATFAVQWFAAGAGAFREARARFIGPAFLGAALLELVAPARLPGHARVPRARPRPSAGSPTGSRARMLTIGALLAALAHRPVEPEPAPRAAAAPRGEPGRRRGGRRDRGSRCRADRALFFVEGRGPHAAQDRARGARRPRRGGGRAPARARLAVHRASPPPGSSRSRSSSPRYGELCFMLYAHRLRSVQRARARLPRRLVLVRVRRAVRRGARPAVPRARRAPRARRGRARRHDPAAPRDDRAARGPPARRLARPAQPAPDRGAPGAAAPRRPPTSGRAAPPAAILTAARRMDRMLRDLADSARAESGRLELASTPVQLRRLRRGAARDLRRRPRRRRASRTTCRPSSPVVLADPDRLDRILANLVGNALKYSTRPGAACAPSARRRVRCGSRSPTAARASRDGDLPRIFERYYRGQRHEGEGLGLGLFIVRKLVEAHGGRISAESRAGRGQHLHVHAARRPGVSGAP